MHLHEGCLLKSSTYLYNLSQARSIGVSKSCTFDTSSGKNIRSGIHPVSENMSTPLFDPFLYQAIRECESSTWIKDKQHKIYTEHPPGKSYPPQSFMYAFSRIGTHSSNGTLSSINCRFDLLNALSVCEHSSLPFLSTGNKSSTSTLRTQPFNHNLTM